MDGLSRIVVRCAATVPLQKQLQQPQLQEPELQGPELQGPELPESYTATGETGQVSPHAVARVLVEVGHDNVSAITLDPRTGDGHARAVLLKQRHVINNPA